VADEQDRRALVAELGRGRPAERERELGRQHLADGPADTVGPEQLPSLSHAGRSLRGTRARRRLPRRAESALRELRALAGLLQAGLLALLAAVVAGQHSAPLEVAAQL